MLRAYFVPYESGKMNLIEAIDANSTLTLIQT